MSIPIEPRPSNFQRDMSGEKYHNQPIEISSKLTAWAMITILVGSAALLAKQIIVAKIPTRDACGVYLPSARAWAAGNLPETQHLTVPPLYPLVVGGVSRVLPYGQDPQEFAGQITGALSVLCLIVCIYSIGRKLFNRRVGLAAAALTGFNPWIIRYGANVGPEMTYAVLLAITVRLLISYRCKARTVTAVGIGLSAALAGLTRSEGIIYPVLVMVVMFLLHLPAKSRAWARTAMHLAIVIVAAGVIWSPRMAFVHSETGYYVPDVRIVSVILPDDQLNPRWWWQSNQIGVVRFSRPGESPRPYSDTWLKRRSWSDGLKEAHESLLLVIGPATWLFAAVWFFARRNLPRRGVGQLIVAAVIVTQIAVVARVGMNNRFISTISGLTQLWGGLGMVVLMERLRSLRGIRGKMGQSIPIQLAGMGALLAGLACWSILGTNVGTRHTELRDLGNLARRDGPGKVILASAPEPAYYADGSIVLVSNPPDGVDGLSRENLYRLCRTHRVDFIISHWEDKWSPWLREGILSGGLPAGAIVGKGGEEKKTSYLIDAKRLFSPRKNPHLESQPAFNAAQQVK